MTRSRCRVSSSTRPSAFRVGWRRGLPLDPHRFGSSLNAHFHFQVCVIDGVFREDPLGSVLFHEATHLMASGLEQMQHTVRHRVLRYFYGASTQGGSASPPTLAVRCSPAVLWRAHAERHYLGLRQGSARGWSTMAYGGDQMGEGIGSGDSNER